MVALKGACRNYDALWYCLARCRDVGSDYNICIFFCCSVLFCYSHMHAAVSRGAQAVSVSAAAMPATALASAFPRGRPAAAAGGNGLGIDRDGVKFSEVQGFPAIWHSGSLASASRS